MSEVGFRNRGHIIDVLIPLDHLGPLVRRRRTHNGDAALSFGVVSGMERLIAVLDTA